VASSQSSHGAEQSKVPASSSQAADEDLERTTSRKKCNIVVLEGAGDTGGDSRHGWLPRLSLFVCGVCERRGNEPGHAEHSSHHLAGVGLFVERGAVVHMLELGFPV
jgi:hypothetical protein